MWHFRNLSLTCVLGFLGRGLDSSGRSPISFHPADSNRCSLSLHTHGPTRERPLRFRMDRLVGCAERSASPSALSNERVSAELKMTAKQKEDLKTKGEKAREEMIAKMREMFQSGDRENMREKMGEAQKDVQKAMVDVLTSDQKKTFEELKGEPFEMPQQGRGGFGGDRGGAGGDRGGRGGGDRGGRGGGDRGGRGGGDRGARGGGRPAAE